ncbi:MAG: thioredoxin-dependent thiol peroxidase [Planctomycetota bacterium]
MAKGTLKIGCRAPAFILGDQDGGKVSLKDLLGQWVVLYFYPKDDTPGCTTEACEFTSQLEQFVKLKARVFGVSPDSSEAHQKFIHKHRLKLQLLSDPTHNVLAKYGAWGKKSMYGRTYEGVIRSTVLICPEGKIAAHWPKVKPAGHAEQVREKLEELAAD